MAHAPQTVETAGAEMVVIEAGRPVPLVEVWRCRGLIAQLASRDLVLRYRQTAIGVAWSVLRPALTAAVLTVVFARVAGLPAYGAPYMAMVLAALIPWQLFATALAEGGVSLAAYPSLITKVYLPRLAIPLASLAVALVDCAVVAALLALVMAWYGEAPPARIVLVPLLLLPALAAAIGAALWAAALNVRYRDVRHLLPFAIQIGLYATPVGYASSAVPAEWRWALALNPLAGAIDGLRWATFAQAAAPRWDAFALSAAIAALILVGGLAYFRSAERGFADVI